MAQNIDHTLVLRVRNQPGVLVRIAHVFARRGCNIKSLHVVPDSAQTDLSTMTITVTNVVRIDQIVHQLAKLIDVASVNSHHHIET